jgi:hypothetical protein
MYLPTGTPHSARSQEQASLHVTIGINRLTWRDLLRRQVDRLLAEQEYDAPLPAGYLTDPERLARPLVDRLTRLTEAVDRLDATEAATGSADAFLADRSPALPGALRDRTLLDELDDDTPLEHRPTATCVLRSGPSADDRLRLLLGDRELRMPGRLAEPMAFVRDHSRLTAGDLAPWLDGSSRLVLCRRLVREGLLRIVR